MKDRKRKRARPYDLLIVRSVADDWYLVPAADHGDWDLLAKYLEEGNELTKKMRTFVVQVLRGRKRKRGAPRNRDTLERSLQMISFVKDAIRDGMTPGKANLAAAAEFKVNVKTIQRAMTFDRWCYDQQEREQEREQDARSEMSDEWNEQNEREDWDDN